jgi:hypothetical protein
VWVGLAGLWSRAGDDLWRLFSSLILGLGWASGHMVWWIWSYVTFFSLVIKRKRFRDESFFITDKISSVMFLGFSLRRTNLMRLLWWRKIRHRTFFTTYLTFTVIKIMRHWSIYFHWWILIMDTIGWGCPKSNPTYPFPFRVVGFQKCSGWSIPPFGRWA